MKSNSYPKARTNDLVIQKSSDELLIYDLTTNDVFCLNSTSSAVWEACNGERDFADISQTACSALGIEQNNDLVGLALAKLSEKKLISNSDEFQPFIDVSRRELIKKIGLSSMVALPIISSILAPSSAHAQSGAVCGGPTIGMMCACGNFTNGEPICSFPGATGQANADGSVQCADSCVCRNIVCSTGGGLSTCRGTCG